MNHRLDLGLIVFGCFVGCMVLLLIAVLMGGAR